MVVVTFLTKEYLWLLRPFTLLFRKHWQGDARIVCFGDEPEGEMPPGVEFRHHGDPKDFFQNFGSVMASALRQLDEEIVMVTLADMWPIGPVAVDKVSALQRYLEARPHVIRASIGNDLETLPRAKIVEMWEGLEINTVAPSEPNIGFRGGALLWPSLWNRELLVDFAEDCTLWEFEVVHSRKMESGPFMAVWAYDLIYPYAHVYFRQQPGRVRNLRHFEAEDRELITSALPGDIETFD